MTSLWLGQIAGRTPREGLDADTEADIVIIGAGFTGLWTAYYLSQLAPQRAILVAEAEHVGFGASGRNGGWCTTEMPSLLANLVRRYGPMDAMRFFRTARKSLDEIQKVLATEGIDAGFARDGSLYVARTPPQVQRLMAWQDMRLKLGITDMEISHDARGLAIDGVLASGFTPYCAAVHPARIAEGLAQAVRRRGVRIAEHTRVTSIEPHLVTTDAGRVRAGAILCATEAYTARLSGHARRVLPVVSRAIATAPLPAGVWQELGWAGRVTVADSRYQFVYFQRTPDDRLLVGGRGVGYRAGSGTRMPASADARAFARLRRAMVELFPQLSTVDIEHRWSGAYGLHRDCEPGVVFDPRTGLGHAGGYGGEGIALSNLAGRTLAAMVSGQSRPETRLCWAGHRSRRWEPEPLRWLGVRAVARLATSADSYEDRMRRPAPLAGWVVRAVL